MVRGTGDGMKPLNIIVPSFNFHSFLYVANVVRQYVDARIPVTIGYGYRSGHINLRIDDLGSTLREGRYCDVCWLDTWIGIKSVHKRVYTNKARIYVTSKYNADMMKKHNLIPDGIIPRPVSLRFLMDNNEYDKKYDAILIGKTESFDRKNFKLAEKIIKTLNLRYIAITDYKGLSNRFNFGSITDKEKIKLIKQSKYLLWLSKAEGFGLPPLEAMILGVPVIYSDAPAHNEFCIGFKIPISNISQVKTLYGISKFYNIDEKTTLETVKKALNISKDEYQSLSEEAKEKALKINQIAVDFIDKLTDGKL